MTTAPVSSLTSARMLRGIKGKGRTAGRLRDILHDLQTEFPIRSPVEAVLVQQAAVLSVISERLQDEHANGAVHDLHGVCTISRGLNSVLTNLRQLHNHSTAMPSAHQRLSTFHETLDLERHGGEQ